MECRTCTYWNELNSDRCTLCDTQFHQEMTLEKWLNDRNLSQVLSQLKNTDNPSLLTRTVDEAPQALAKIKRKHAIKLAFELGKYQAIIQIKREFEAEKVKLKSEYDINVATAVATAVATVTRITDDRMIMMEQDKDLIISELTDKVKTIRRVDAPCGETQSICKSDTIRRRTIADSWSKKFPSPLE